jgi:hypothetical protein
MYVFAHTSTFRLSSFGSLDTDFGAGVPSGISSSAAAAEAALLRVGIVGCVGQMTVANVVASRLGVLRRCGSA